MQQIKKNCLLEVTISDICANGNGVAKLDGGFVVFVPNSAVGDFLLVKLIKVKKNFAVGKVEKILQPSPMRFGDGCPYLHKCGGCVFQHIGYEHESKYKENSINDAFSHISGMNLKIDKYYKAQNINEYRNKAIYPLSLNNNGEIVSGFYAQMSHRIVEHDKCFISPQIFTDIRKLLLSFFENNQIKPYDEIELSGCVRNIYLRGNYDFSSVILTLILNTSCLKDKKTEEKLVNEITASFPEICSICINVNSHNTNAVLGDKWRVIYGTGYLEDVLCGKKFYISPASFYQVNHSQTEVLYGVVKDFAQIAPEDKVLDLYCGIGTIGICISDENTALTGVEIVPSAVNDAKKNAEINGLSNAEFYCLDANDSLSDKRVLSLKPDIILLDPPRKGCGTEASAKICELGAKRIVYVSCDPTTLARDLPVFINNGYEIAKTAAVDMFPRTGHVECCVLLCRTQHSSL